LIFFHLWCMLGGSVELNEEQPISVHLEPNSF